MSNARNRLPITVLAVLGSVAAGCATADREPRAESQTPAFNDCIINRGIRDYYSLDDQNVILYGIGRQAYHVILSTPAIDLQREFTIGVVDGGLGAPGDGRICPYGGDAILVDGPIRQTVPIRSIERIDDTAVEALKVRFGQIDGAEAEITTTEIQ